MHTVVTTKLMKLSMCRADECRKPTISTKRPRFTGWLTPVGQKPLPFYVENDGAKLVSQRTKGDVLKWAVERGDAMTDKLTAVTVKGKFP